ncbi:pyruvate dehydrogenase (acetyl-transferring) E1 component subunit alpha [Mycoplasmopsis opalescens]|uniref:pyruvate dehydrogenase (acetyl-transferring) E1 component subunit alpha n=1 Tax=Mycoplasmopsis opalescens TaxID=114886 RepID=UPI0004A72972|nr:pyruvate dehydrogenase (acetyl-transferring) E1 component subunit alpha [Mycoplasmopsis opalescens]
MEFKHIEAGKVMTYPKAMIRHLDIDGNLIEKNYKTSISSDTLVKMYENMVKSRAWDNYALTLQKTGRLGTFAPSLGEEALLTAVGYSMKDEDFFVPHYRVLGALLARGVSYEQIYLYWKGSELGGSFFNKNILPYQVIIGAQISQAAGVAYAIKAKGEKKVALTMIGNGGTNEGEFHEALNLAAVRKLPLVVVISNNQWAISVPEHNSYSVPTLSQRAMSYGIPGIRVDGNDLLAVSEVLNEAVEWARNNNGPVLVEAVTWRQGQHTTSDDPRVYRSREMEEEKEKWEPFHRIEKYLFEHGLITQAKIDSLYEKYTEEAKAANESSNARLTEEGYDDIYKYTYETLPAELEEQKQENMRFLKK